MRGHAFVFTPALSGVVPVLSAVSPSTASAPTRSRLSIYEDGRLIGPANALHDNIALAGRGRFPYWNSGHGASTVLFSASDNSDPRINGRRDVIRAPWQLAPVVVAALLPSARGGARPPLWRHAGVAAGRACCRRRVAGPGLGCDSGHNHNHRHHGTCLDRHVLGVRADFQRFRHLSYLGGICARGLSVVSRGEPLANGRRGMGCHATWRLLRSKVLVVPLALALVCYTPAFRHASFILSDAVFVALVLVNAGAALRFIRTGAAADGFLLGLSAAIAIAVRPAGYYLPLGTLFLLLACNRMALKVLTRAAVPFAGCMLAITIASVAVRGQPGQSILGFALFPAIGHLFEPANAPADETGVAQAVYDALATYRTTMAQSGLDARFRETRNFFNERSRRIRIAMRDARMSVRQMNDVLFRYCLSAIASKPAGYAEHILTQVYGAWKWDVLTNWGATPAWFKLLVNDVHASLLPVFKNIELPRSAAPVPLERFEVGPGRLVGFYDTGFKVLRSMRWAILAIGAFTFVAMFAALTVFRGSRHWLALGYLGVLIHGSLFLVAAATVVIPRYVLPVDPLLIVAGVLILDLAVGAALDRFGGAGRACAAAASTGCANS